MIESNQQLFGTVQQLIDAWCDRRSLKALKAVLRVYPPPPVLIDGWHELLLGLQDVRATAQDERASADWSMTVFAPSKALLAGLKLLQSKRLGPVH